MHTPFSSPSKKEAKEEESHYFPTRSTKKGVGKDFKVFFFFFFLKTHKKRRLPPPLFLLLQKKASKWPKYLLFFFFITFFSKPSPPPNQQGWGWKLSWNFVKCLAPNCACSVGTCSTKKIGLNFAPKKLVGRLLLVGTLQEAESILLSISKICKCERESRSSQHLSSFRGLLGLLIFFFSSSFHLRIKEYE